jgi:hypothetical protein
VSDENVDDPEWARMLVASGGNVGPYPAMVVAGYFDLLESVACHSVLVFVIGGSYHGDCGVVESPPGLANGALFVLVDLAMADKCARVARYNLVIVDVLQYWERLMGRTMKLEVGMNVRLVGPTRSALVGSEGEVTRVCGEFVQVHFRSKRSVTRRLLARCLVPCEVYPEYYEAIACV